MALTLPPTQMLSVTTSLMPTSVTFAALAFLTPSAIASRSPSAVNASLFPIPT